MKMVNYKDTNPDLTEDQWKGYGNNKSLKFHSSWSWLMPVVDKCSQLDDKNYSGGMFTVELWMFVTNDIGAVWESVVKFIKWHTTNP